MSPHSKGNLNDLPTADKSLRIATSIKKRHFINGVFLCLSIFYANNLLCQLSLKGTAHALSN